MKWLDKRDAFYRLAVQHGVSSRGQLEKLFPLGYDVPESIMDRWVRRLGEAPADFSSQRRYVNRFKLGADPEFIFTVGVGRKDASAFHLKQGLAFGADNNGRLTEIRPYPSRSALEVVASILETFRWMVFWKPLTLGYQWQAGAFLQDDGLGGHVHFGRKRPDRALEIKALDVIEEDMLTLGWYPMREVMARRGGDAHNQKYGGLSDFRLQTHGYEYRTFPSWLDSPALAFLTLTLSKLAVHDPDVIKGMKLDKKQMFYRLRNLLSYYKDMDDDARLALRVLNNQKFTHKGGDFRTRWGFGIPLIGPGPNVKYIPSAIKPSPFTSEEVFAHLRTGEPIINRMPAMTWEPAGPPEGYKMMIDETPTNGAKGIGELVWNLCYHKDFPIFCEPVKDDKLLISTKLAAQLPKGWERGLDIKCHGGEMNSIFVGTKAREGQAAVATKRALLCGLFPIWRVQDVKDDSYVQWKQHVQVKALPVVDRGVILFKSREIPGVI